MIVCNSLAEAAKVPNVVLIVASSPPVAYQQGDALPVYAVIDPTATAAETTRLTGIDTQIANGTVGTVTPQSAAQLKAMDWATYSAWFDANFTTALQCIPLLKKLLLVVARRDF